jgi:hypothetical protein
MTADNPLLPPFAHGTRTSEDICIRSSNPPVARSRSATGSLSGVHLDGGPRRIPHVGHVQQCKCSARYTHRLNFFVRCPPATGRRVRRCVWGLTDLTHRPHQWPYSSHLVAGRHGKSGQVFESDNSVVMARTQSRRVAPLDSCDLPLYLGSSKSPLRVTSGRGPLQDVGEVLGQRSHLVG